MNITEQFPFQASTSSGYSTGSNQDSPVPSSSADDSMITYVGASSPNGARGVNGYGIASYSSSGSPTHLVVKPVASNPMMPGSNPAQRNMMRLPANPPRSLPQPPRSLPMPPTYRFVSTILQYTLLQDNRKGSWANISDLFRTKSLRFQIKCIY